MIKQVKVDRERCMGCGTCWVSEPGVFRESGEYLAEVTGELAEPSVLRRVAGHCPSFAISLMGMDGVLLFPTEEDRAARESADWV